MSPRASPTATHRSEAPRRLAVAQPPTASGRLSSRLRSHALPLITLILAALLLFARLGHNALWSDEANAALIAKGVWLTGDTSAVVGDNIVAYRNGAELVGTMERYMPPLQYYLAAPFVAAGGTSAVAARLPFALCGLASIALMLHWARRQGADGLTQVLLAMGILGNVSLFLFCRQCRYYAPAMLATLAIAYFYCTWNGRRWRLAAMAGASLALLASNYMNFLALYACLALDYVLWGRRRRKLALADWVVLLVPQALVGSVIVHIWNPLGKPVLQDVPASWLADRFLLLWWNFRDIGLCEFGVLALLIAAPILVLKTRNVWLLRGSVALAVYAAAITFFSPQTVHAVAADGRVATVSRFADMRYLAAVLPLCIGLGVAVLAVLRRWLKGMVLLVAVLAFGSNVLHGCWIYDAVRGERGAVKALTARWLIRSTLYYYLEELANPPADPYRAAADWISSHVPAGKSVLVSPDYMVYPLMFHAPHAVYAWQLEPPAAPGLDHLSEIHYRYKVAPDYIVQFGPSPVPFRADPGDAPLPPYRPVAHLDVYWHEAQRPELFIHVFGGVRYYDHEKAIIFIFQAQPAEAPDRAR